MWYRLEGREPVPCTIDEAGWEPGGRIVAQDYVGELLVSTVFLCLDHSFGDGPPVLFETMVFGAEKDRFWSESYCERYCTYDEAEAGHARVLTAVRQAVKELDP